MAQRIIDLTLATVASAAAFALSWPFWRDFQDITESRGMWWLYFGIGFVLAIYVFFVFIGTTRTLFQHDAIQRAASGSSDKAGVP